MDLVVSGLNRELISHLTFHSYQYACGKLDHVSQTIVGYKWINISMSDMYWSLGIIMKMALISSDIDGLNHFGIH